MLNQCLGLAAVIAIAVKLGNDNIVLQRLSATNNNPRPFIFSTIKVRITLSIFISIIGFLCKDFFQYGIAAVIFTSFLIFFQAIDIGSFWLRSIDNHREVHLITIISTASSALVIIFLIYRKLNWVYFIIPSAISFMIISLASAFSANHKDKRKSIPCDIKITRTESIWAFINSLVVILYFKIDFIILPNLIGLEKAGNYFAAQRISDVALLVLGAFSLILTTRFSKNLKSSANDTLNLMASSLNVGFYAGLICSLIFLFIANEIIFGFYLSSYKFASEALYILSIGTPLFLQGSIIDAYFVAKSQFELIALKAIMALALKLILLCTLSTDSSLTQVSTFSVAGAYLASLMVIYLGEKKLFFLQLKSINPFGLPSSFSNLIKNFQNDS